MSDTEDETAVRSFFGAGNLITFEKITQAKLPTEQVVFLSAAIQDLEQRSHPVLLPRQVTDPEVQTIWYAIAFEASQARQLQRELYAAVGVSYTNFSRSHAPLEPEDAVDEAATTLAGSTGSVFKFKVVDPTGPGRGQVQQSLVRLRESWRRRPTRSVPVHRPTGRILRDFRQALNVGDASASEEYLTELRNHGRLSAVNLLFLKVERLSSLGRWRELLNLEDLDRLIRMRRPALVSNALATAVWQVELAHEVEDLPSLLETFKTRVRPRYDILIADYSQAVSPEAVAYWVLSRANSNPSAISAWLNDTEGPGWLRTIAGALVQPEVAQPT
jgi:hypothetical protein